MTSPHLGVEIDELKQDGVKIDKLSFLVINATELVTQIPKHKQVINVRFVDAAFVKIVLGKRMHFGLKA